MRPRSLAVLAVVALALAIAAFSLGGSLGSSSQGTPGPLPPESKVRIGLTSGGGDPVSSPLAAQLVGAKLVRIDFAIGTAPDDMRTTIADYADRGMSSLLLATFSARIPTEDEARNLAGWAREYGPGGGFWANRSDGRLAVRQIEFGNETSYADQGTQDRGGEYAVRFRDAYDAINGPGGNPEVGLLAQGDDAGISERWVNDMFDTVPDLADMVNGWTVHPYGPPDVSHARIDRLIAQTAGRGASRQIPIDVTEWGLTTDDGRCLSDNYGWENRCMTYGTAAEALRQTVTGFQARYGDRMRSFVLYQATDQRVTGATSDREHYFGALKNDLGDKGAYTSEVRSLLARRSHPSTDARR